MKHGTKPTKNQKNRIEQAGWNSANWLVERDTPTEMILIHRNTGIMKVLK